LVYLAGLVYLVHLVHRQDERNEQDIPKKPALLAVHFHKE